MRFRPVIIALFLMSASSLTAVAVDLLYVSMSDASIVTYDVSNGISSDIVSSKSVYVTGVSASFGMTFDSSGNLYANNRLENSIVKVSNDLSLSIFISTGLNFPWGLANDSSGNLYVGNNIGHNISKITSDGSISLYASTPDMVYGVALDSSKNLYFSAPGGISKVLSDGTVTALNYPNMVKPWSLVFDSSDNLFIADAQGYYPENNGTGIIRKITPDGVSSLFVVSGLDFPFGMSFDSLGYLYVSNWNNNTISRVNPTGGVDFSWSTGSLTPNALAFRPIAVPEPSTCALSAIAIGVLTYLATRQKKRPSKIQSNSIRSFTQKITPHSNCNSGGPSVKFHSILLPNP